VRNSGAIAVIEGTGHHLCEYMTKGTVMVLGEAGFNIGAGMTGGVIYILDENDYVEGRLNTDYVIASALADEREILTVRNIMESHHRHTQSARAKEILTYPDTYLSSFKKVIPRSH
jgi:glutamate synthase domain-containing protein 3